MSTRTLKPHLKRVYHLDDSWEPDYRPTACRLCGHLLDRYTITGVCEDGGALFTDRDPAGEWVTTAATCYPYPLSAHCPRSRQRTEQCSRTERFQKPGENWLYHRLNPDYSEQHLHEPVSLTQCARCGGWYADEVDHRDACQP
jgi:hypothetical protein